MSSRAVFVLLPVLFALTGCARDVGLSGQQSRVIQSSDPDRVMLAAASILRREFGRVHLNTEARTITAGPVEYATTSESGSVRDLYRGRSTLRRQARCTVGRRGKEIVVRICIDVERQDTARALTMQQPAGRLSDSPGYTPIERDAATTERQNTVWTRVRRDRRLERAILDELQEQYAPPPTEPAAAEAAAEEPSEGPADGTP